MLADAKYLHQKFSVLKNVGKPSTMLEVVVSEKSVARQPALISPRPSAPSVNERMKTMLSRRTSANYSPVEKALPTPTPTLPWTPPLNGTPINESKDSLLGTPSRPGTPRAAESNRPGFKQVATPLSPEPPRRPESPLPALPTEEPESYDDSSRPELLERNSSSTGAELKPAERPPRSSSLGGSFVDGGRDASSPRSPSPGPTPVVLDLPSPVTDAYP